MGPESILLSVLGGGSEGTYRFVCPMCTGSVEKRADRKIVALLVSAGVDVAEAGGAVEQTEFDYTPAADDGGRDNRPIDAPPFTIDDVIRFHFLLEDEQFIRSLLDGN